MSKRFLPLLLIVALFTTCCALPKTVYPSPITVMKSETAALVMVDSQGTFPFCTAVFVENPNDKNDDRLLLSARHCAVAVMSFNLPPVLRAYMMQVADTTGTEINYVVEADTRNLGEEPRQTHSAVVIAQDLEHDLVLMRLKKNDIPFHRKVKVAHSIEVGDKLFIMGGQKGLLYTFMTGTVAAIRTEIPDIVDGLGIHGPFIQVFSSIAPGNSGGGVFDEDGELVGIVSFTMAAPNQGFAIHLQSIRSFMHQALKHTKDNQECSGDSCPTQ